MLKESECRFMEALVIRHPQRKTHCGRLLAAIISEDDKADRPLAAHLFLKLRCRRGLHILEKELSVLAHNLDKDKEHAEQQKSLAIGLFDILGSFDKPRSHANLVQYATSASTSFLRANALCAMGFEKEQADPAFLCRRIANIVELREVLAALNALDWLLAARSDPDLIEKTVTPLLAHPDSTLRWYAILVLRHNKRFREAIRELADDPCNLVRDAVRDASFYAT